MNENKLWVTMFSAFAAISASPAAAQQQIEPAATETLVAGQSTTIRCTGVISVVQGNPNKVVQCVQSPPPPPPPPPPPATGFPSCSGTISWALPPNIAVGTFLPYPNTPGALQKNFVAKETYYSVTWATKWSIRPTDAEDWKYRNYSMTVSGAITTNGAPCTVKFKWDEIYYTITGKIETALTPFAMPTTGITSAGYKSCANPQAYPWTGPAAQMPDPRIWAWVEFRGRWVQNYKACPLPWDYGK